MATLAPLKGVEVEAALAPLGEVTGRGDISGERPGAWKSVYKRKEEMVRKSRRRREIIGSISRFKYRFSLNADNSAALIIPESLVGSSLVTLIRFLERY